MGITTIFVTSILPDMKKWIAGIWLTLLLVVIASVFWFNQFVYSLPTPVPIGYKPIPVGTRLDLHLTAAIDPEKPLFLHFFNPDCPCSRFNIKEFKSLVREYQHDMNFVVVLVSDKDYTPEEVKQRFDIDQTVVKDPYIAQSTGVYATPQAVLITADHQLYYRGNYNRSRYCTDEKTRYAKQAVNNLLLNHKTKLEPLAFKAYGCSTPNCSY